MYSMLIVTDFYKNRGVIYMYKKILLVIVLCFMMTGCSLFPDGSISGSEEKEVQVNEDNNIKHINTTISSKVSVDADIPDYSGISLKEFKAQYKDWTEQQMTAVSDIFCNNREVKDYNNYERRVYTYNDDSKLIIGTGLISFYTGKVGERNYNIYIGNVTKQENDAKEAFPQEELENLPKDKVIDEVRKVCDNLEIKLSEDVPVCYAFDSESATKVMMNYEDNLRYNKTKDGQIINEITWNYEDEVYYMEFDVELEGIPLSRYSFMDNSKASFDTKLTVVYGRNGIEEFEVYSLYDIVETDDNIKLADIDDIVKQLSAYLMYNNQLDEQVINDIKLVYLPTKLTGSSNKGKPLTISPFWVCTVTKSLYAEKDGISSTDHEQNMIFINAQNKDTYKSNNIGFK